MMFKPAKLARIPGNLVMFPQLSHKKYSYPRTLITPIPWKNVPDHPERPDMFPHHVPVFVLLLEINLFHHTVHHISIVFHHISSYIILPVVIVEHMEASMVPGCSRPRLGADLQARAFCAAKLGDFMGVHPEIGDSLMDLTVD